MLPIAPFAMLPGTPQNPVVNRVRRGLSEDEKVEYHECVDEHERYCNKVSTNSVIHPTNVLLISVRTDDTKFMSRAFTLASSRWPPNPGSAADDVQPTAPCVSKALGSKVGAWWLGEVSGRMGSEVSYFLRGIGLPREWLWRL